MAFKRKQIAQMQGEFDPVLFGRIGEAVLRNERLASFVAYITSAQRTRVDARGLRLMDVHNSDFESWLKLHGDEAFPGRPLPKETKIPKAGKWD